MFTFSNANSVRIAAIYGRICLHSCLRSSIALSMRVNFCTHKFTDLRFSGNLMPVVNIQRSITLNEEGLLNSGDPSLIATGGDFQIDLARSSSRRDS